MTFFVPPPPPPYVVVVVVCFVFDFFFSCCVWFLVVVIQLKTVCLSAVISNNLLRSTFSKEQEQSMKIQWTLSGHQNSGHFLWEVINVDLEWTWSKYISLGYSRTDADSERLPSTTTACHLFIRKLPVHMLALPLIPYNYSAGICVAGDCGSPCGMPSQSPLSGCQFACCLPCFPRVLPRPPGAASHRMFFGAVYVFSRFAIGVPLLSWQWCAPALWSKENLAWYTNQGHRPVVYQVIMLSLLVHGRDVRSSSQLGRSQLLVNYRGRWYIRGWPYNFLDVEIRACGFLA